MIFLFKILRKKTFFFLLFFSCFSLKSLSIDKNEFSLDFAKDSKKPVVIDQNYFQTQSDMAYLKSEMAYYIDQTGVAIDFLKESILQAPQSLHLRSRLADIYFEEKLFAEAAQQYQTLFDQTNDQKFYYKLAKIYSLRGLNQENSKNYKKLNKDKSFSVVFQKARLFIDEKAWSLALKTLNQMEKKTVKERERVDIFLSKAYIYEQTHQKEKQEKIFKQILNLDLSEEDLLLKTAQFYMSSNQLERAKLLLLKYQQKEETSIGVTKALFNLFLSLNQLNGAYEQLRQLEKLDSLDDPHYFFMVSFLLSKKQYAKAIPFVKDLVQAYPQTSYYRYLLGATYEQEKEWKKSLQEYKKIRKESSYFIAAQIQMGQIWKDQGQAKKALNLLEKVVFSSENVKEPKPLLLYAQYLWEEGQKDLSLSVLTKGLQRFPKNTDILFLRGLYFKEHGRVASALKDMEKILELDERHGESLNFIAYTYAEKKQKLDQAEILAHKALLLNPASSYFLDTLGWVLFQKGDTEKALFYLKKAFSYNQKDSSIANHLGEIYYRLKNFEKYEYFFKKALELETDEKKRSQIKKRLASLQSHF